MKVTKLSFCSAELQPILSKDSAKRAQYKMKSQRIFIFIAELQYILSKDSAKRVHYNRYLFKKNVQEHEAQLEEAQKLLDYWNAVKAEHERVKAEEAKAESEQVKTENNNAEEVKAEEVKAEETQPKVTEEETSKQAEQSESSELQGTSVGTSNQGGEQGEEVNNPKPIGKGFFGNIYDQFRGKVKAAFDFLLKNKSGDLLGVFHRNDLGDIDLVWGDYTGGLTHMIRRHIEEQNDFANVEEMCQVIDDVIKNGVINNKKSKWDKIVLEKDGKVVIIRKNVRDEKGNIINQSKNWIVTSFDDTKTKKSKKKEQSSDVTRATPNIDKGSRAVTPDESSSTDKDTNNPNTTQVEERKKDFSTKKKKQKVNTTESLSKDSGLHIGKGNGKYVVNQNDILPTKKDLKESAYKHLLNGVHYENGVAYLTSGEKLVAIRCDYPEEYEGKTIMKGGETNPNSYPTTSQISQTLNQEGYPFNDSKSVAQEISRIPNKFNTVVLNGIAYEYRHISPIAKIAGKTKNAQLLQTEDGKLCLRGDGVSAICMPRVDENHNYRDGFVDKTYDIDKQKVYLNGDGVAISAKEFFESTDNTKHSLFDRKKKSGEVEPLSDGDVSAITEVSDYMGQKLSVVDSAVDSEGRRNNGLYDPNTGTIYLARDGQQPMGFVFGHEATHAVKEMSEGAYGDLHSAVRDLMGDEKWNAEVAYKKQLYKDNGIELTDEGAAEEVVADYVGSTLNQGENLKKLAYRLKHPVLSKIRESLTKLLDFFRGKKMTAEEKQVQGMLDTITEAMRNAKADGERNGKQVKHSIFDPRFEKGGENELSPEERLGAEVMNETLKKAIGDDSALIDGEVGQRVLDDANKRGERVRLHSMLSSLMKAENTITSWIKSKARGKSFQLELPQYTQLLIRRVMGKDYDSHNIAINGIKHGFNNHGTNGRKLTKGSIPIREEDAALIPYIITAPDYVRKGSTDIDGRESIKFYKTLSNGYVVVVEKEYKNSPDDMETINFWAEMSDKAIDAQRNAAPGINVQNAILDIDAAKIRKDAEDAIKKEAKIREQRVSTDLDSQYFAAVERGDMDTAKRLVETAAKLNGFESDESWKMSHEAPDASGYYPSLDDISEMMPDIYGENAFRYYGSSSYDAYGVIRTIQSVHGNPDAMVTIYRAVPADIKDGSARNGDWVTLSREYAKDHGISNINGKYRIIEQEVPAKNLYSDGNSIFELGYDDGRDYNYRNTKNNRKLNDVVTYDDKGNIIPLSKIFNYKSGDVRFFRTKDGVAYGFTVGGKVYIDPRVATAETPIHEYSHLWATAMQKGNPKEWDNIVKLMKGTSVWDEVRKTYPELENDSDIADEVLAHYSGRRGAERLREQMRAIADGKGSPLDKADAMNALHKVKAALNKFWKGVADFLGIHFTTAEEVADRVMKDLLDGVDPREHLTKEDIETDSALRFHKEKDEDTLKKLNSEPTIKVYRAMQVIDGKLYPPMAAKVGKGFVEPNELGVWIRADENPNLAKPKVDKTTGETKWYFDLNKGSKDPNGKDLSPTNGVAYNPYWHTSLSPLNDQFATAWIRPNLVVVECEIPASELTSGYKAEKAHDSVGETPWKSGKVSTEVRKQTGRERKVILSRWCKPVRILSDAEVAQKSKEFIGDVDVEIPENVLTPRQKIEFEKVGLKVGAPEKRYNKTEQIKEAIRKGLMVDNSLKQDEDAIGNAKPLLNVIHTLYEKGKEFAAKLFNMKFFDVAKTPDFMKGLGLTGDKFTIRYGVIARHFGKDGEHTLPEKIWEQLPMALRNPFAITKYYTDENKQHQKGYRLYTSLQLDNGAFVVVSAEVKNAGRNIEVNAINTIFGRDKISSAHDELIYTSKEITPEQQALLNENNPRQYLESRELSNAKVEKKSNTEQQSSGENLFRLKDSTFIKSGSYFSGGGLLEEGLKRYLDPSVAVEFNEKISGVYADNFGNHIVTADVRDVDPRELAKHIDGEVQYLHKIGCGSAQHSSKLMIGIWTCITLLTMVAKSKTLVTLGHEVWK